MKNDKIAIALSIIVLLAVLVFAVSTVSAPPPANAVYFVPQHSTITGGPGNVEYVELWVNVTDPINTWQADIEFNPACVNITGVAFNGSWISDWGWAAGKISLGGTRYEGGDMSCIAGNFYLANLTIHCEAWDCTSPLNFTGALNEGGERFLWCEDTGTYINAIWHNGTVTNEASSIATTGDININEIMYDPPGTDANHEWIEIYNNYTKAINITGWKFYEAGTNHSLTLEQGSMTIPVEGYAIIADNATMFLHEYPECTCTVIDSVFSLGNTEEYIALKNATLDIIDYVTYNASWGAKDNNKTLELNATGSWEESRDEGGTPCQLNSVLAGAVPTADGLGVEDTGGSSGTYVEVPVNITNVMNGPVQSIRLRVDYNESVLNLTNISSGDLTSAWTNRQLGEDRHTMVIATGHPEDAILDGSSGSVMLLNFSVIGSPGDTSPMNMSLIELANPDGDVGTAPAKNGTFVVSRLGSIVGRITYACNGTGIAGVVVNLTNESSVHTTVTNETGYYNFTDVIPGSYFVNASKSRFWDNSTEVTVIAGETTTADMMLWLKGDLNNNCDVADAGDVVLMLRASVGDISGDMRYDLNNNENIADAGDVVLMLRASVGDIELL